MSLDDLLAEITREHLHPALRQAGVENPENFRIVYDLTPVTMQPSTPKPDYPSCQVPVWDGPYKMTCGRQMPKGECMTHGKPQ